MWALPSRRLRDTVYGHWRLRTFSLGVAGLVLAGNGSIVKNGLGKRLAFIFRSLGESSEYLGHFGRLEPFLINSFEFGNKLDDTVSRNLLRI